MITRAEKAERAYMVDVARRKSGVARARHVLADAANKVGDEAITAVVLPTIERIIQGGVDLVDLEGHDGKGLVRVLRVSGLASRLKKIGLTPELCGIALRFNRDFEKARIGGLVANYDGGAGGKKSAEPERWCDAMDLLTKASAKLEHDERVALYGYVLFDVSAADLGAFLCSDLTRDREVKIFLEKYLLNKALNKLTDFYEDWDWRVMMGHIQAKNA